MRKPGRPTIFMEKFVLASALELAGEIGIQGLTARKIATKMKTSTQPIYTLFVDMEELKSETKKLIEKEMNRSVFQTGEGNYSLLSLCVCYVGFAQENSFLYGSLYIDESVDKRQVFSALYRKINQRVEFDSVYEELSPLEKKGLGEHVLIYLIGLGELVSSGQIELNPDAVRKMTMSYLNQMKHSMIRYFENEQALYRALVVSECSNSNGGIE